jgi:Holliday junction resolvasome RuvABC ATP-dependent DNA helicase subunit
VERAKQARELFLVIGPPGTGKTSFGLLNILREELLEADTSILLLSYTNRAVDEICSKLKEQSIDFIRIGSEISCDKAYHANLLRKTSRSQSFSSYSLWKPRRYR